MSFTGLTNYHLKLLAAATMVIDHVGVVFYPDNDWLRIVGRISFPLFVWLLGAGRKPTPETCGNTACAWRRWGVLSQPLYQIVLDANRPNILFQLLLGLVCLRLTRRFSTFALPIWILGAIVALLTETSYGAYGIALTAMTRYFQPGLIWWAGWAGVHLLWAVDAGPFQASGNWGSDPCSGLPTVNEELKPAGFTAFIRATWRYSGWPSRSFGEFLE